jgi:hypothetical protein
MKEVSDILDDGTDVVAHDVDGPECGDGGVCLRNESRDPFKMFAFPV